MKTNSSFMIDFNQFKKIEDIIFVDEPILSHLKRNDKNFFMYLIDTVEHYDKYLLFEIEEELIFKYLTAKVKLYDVITNNKNISYFVDQDFNGNLINISVTECSYLDKKYLPMEDSYLEYEPSEDSYYFKLIKEYESKSYLESLRSNAFYVKFSPTNEKYADTIGLNELSSNLLSNLSSSFKSFLKADFFHQFKDEKTDLNKLTTLFNRLLPDLDFRTVDFKYGSFEVGLAVDKVMKGSIEDKNIKSWSLEVGNKYKDLVLDDEYDKLRLEYILSSYKEEDRKKIFSPIFKIIENPNYSLKVRWAKQSNYTTVRVKDKSTISKIIPPQIILPPVEEVNDYAIVQVTTVVDKNKLKKTFILENTLFSSTNATEVVLTNKNFEKFGYRLDFEISIPVNISTSKNTVSLSTMFDGVPFEVEYHSDKIDDGIAKITSNIFEYIMNRDT
ncbi:MAG TPA: hypothetical protein DER05_05035 [Lutibacter sp.]|nr:hypothetical protein [Lutibacter sp.]